ncbi:AAA family ATPase [Nocardioides piscis]|uniref:Chromosome partitioning protein n=1 Tax=Nocardioides piscis TaxID=2714938 RepID=A0A6G7YC01_9ACTN|nr:hypothetical protein [Nocardioides piscis]QIK74137.1 hypothetical protein G7071_00470 [Nocardioides piscis]
MICVLMMASGAAWESDAFATLTRAGGIVVLKRCVDVDDLLATATSGQTDVAVVGLDAPGLDPAALAHLRRHAVRPVAVCAGDAADPRVVGRAQRLGISTLVPDADLASLAEVVSTVEAVADTRVRGDAEPAPPATAETRGRVLAVWGPGGAPGRTTVAVSVAAELARRNTDCVLVDADPYGGGIAQQLGILDEVSGLLSAVRLAGAGQLGERFASTTRAIGERLSVVTGLPRADRWIEVRSSHLETLLDEAREAGEVVVDTGFSVEGDPTGDFGTRPSRNAMTVTSLTLADEIVVVGAADPVGLSRLARSLVDLRDVTGGAPVRVVVNKMRASLGWSEREIAGMVEGFSRVSSLHFLPWDQAVTDRALVAGRALPEVSDGPLPRALSGLVDALAPASVVGSATRRTRLRRRRSVR